MFEIRDMQRVGWRNRSLGHHYVGSMTLTDESVRLAGHEDGGSIDAALAIPLDSIRRVRLGRGAADAIGDDPGLVLELDDGESVVLRPFGDARTELRLAKLLGRLQRAVGDRSPS